MDQNLVVSASLDDNLSPKLAEIKAQFLSVGEGAATATGGLGSFDQQLSALYAQGMSASEALAALSVSLDGNASASKASTTEILNLAAATGVLSEADRAELLAAESLRQERAALVGEIQAEIAANREAAAAALEAGAGNLALGNAIIAVNDEAAASGAAMIGMGAAETAVGTEAAGAAVEVGALDAAIGAAVAPIAALVVVVGGVALAFAGAVSDAKDFQAQIVKVQNNTDMSAAATEQMSKSVLDLSAKYGVGADVVSQGYMKITNFGFQANDAQKVLNASMMSAVSTGGDVAKTSELAASALHQYKLSGDEALPVVNAIHEGAVLGDATFEQFASTMSSTIAIAAALNVPLQDVVAAQSALTRTGMPAAKAQTQMVAILARLAKPTKQSADAFDALSQKSGDLDLSSKNLLNTLSTQGLSGVVDHLKAAYEKLGYSQVDATNETMTLMNAQRGGLGMAVLLGQGNADYANALNKVGDAMSGKINPAQQAMNNTNQTAQQQLAILGTTIKDDAIQIGEKFLPTLLSLTKEFLSMLPAIMGIANAIGSVLNPVFQVLGFLLSAIGTLLQPLGALFSAFGNQANEGTTQASNAAMTMAQIYKAAGTQVGGTMAQMGDDANASARQMGDAGYNGASAWAQNTTTGVQKGQVDTGALMVALQGTGEDTASALGDSGTTGGTAWGGNTASGIESKQGDIVTQVDTTKTNVDQTKAFGNTGQAMGETYTVGKDASIVKGIGDNQGSVKAAALGSAVTLWQTEAFAAAGYADGAAFNAALAAAIAKSQAGTLSIPSPFGTGGIGVDGTPYTTATPDKQQSLDSAAALANAQAKIAAEEAAAKNRHLDTAGGASNPSNNPDLTAIQTDIANTNAADTVAGYKAEEAKAKAAAADAKKAAGSAKKAADKAASDAKKAASDAASAATSRESALKSDANALQGDRKAVDAAQAAIDATAAQKPLTDATKALKDAQGQAALSTQMFGMALANEKKDLDNLKAAEAGALAPLNEGLQKATSELKAMQTASADAANATVVKLHDLNAALAAVEAQGSKTMQPFIDQTKKAQDAVNNLADATAIADQAFGQALHPLEDQMYALEQHAKVVTAADQAAVDQAQASADAVQARWDGIISKQQAALDAVKQQEQNVQNTDVLGGMRQSVTNLQGQLAGAKAGSDEYKRLQEELSKAQGALGLKTQEFSLADQLKATQDKAAAEEKAAADNLKAKQAIQAADQKQLDQDKANIQSKEDLINRTKAEFDYEQKVKQEQADADLKFAQKSQAAAQDTVDKQVAAINAQITATQNLEQERTYAEGQVEIQKNKEINGWNDKITKTGDYYKGLENNVNTQITDTQNAQTATDIADKAAIVSAQARVDAIKGRLDQDKTLADNAKAYATLTTAQAKLQEDQNKALDDLDPRVKTIAEKTQEANDNSAAYAKTINEQLNPAIQGMSDKVGTFTTSGLNPLKDALDSSQSTSVAGAVKAAFDKTKETSIPYLANSGFDEIYTHLNQAWIPQMKETLIIPFMAFLQGDKGLGGMAGIATAFDSQWDTIATTVEGDVQRVNRAVDGMRYPGGGGSGGQQPPSQQPPGSGQTQNVSGTSPFTAQSYGGYGMQSVGGGYSGASVPYTHAIGTQNNSTIYNVNVSLPAGVRDIPKTVSEWMPYARNAGIAIRTVARTGV